MSARADVGNNRAVVECSDLRDAVYQARHSGASGRLLMIWPRRRSATGSYGHGCRYARRPSPPSRIVSPRVICGLGNQAIHRDAWFRHRAGREAQLRRNTIEEIAKFFPDHSSLGRWAAGRLRTSRRPRRRSRRDDQLLHSAGFYTRKALRAQSRACDTTFLLPRASLWRQTSRARLMSTTSSARRSSTRLVGFSRQQYFGAQARFS